jgi:hypothetical protein
MLRTAVPPEARLFAWGEVGEGEGEVPWRKDGGAEVLLLLVLV